MTRRALLLLPLNNISRNAGFTLLELTLVLFIIALMLGGLLTPLATRMEQEGRKSTQRMLQDIRASLLGYTVINGHLPCPDCPNSTITAGCATVNNAAPTRIGDGIEDGMDDSRSTVRARGAFAACATETGLLPWVTLGTPEKDAWGQPFAYGVDEDFADDLDGQTGASCTAATASAGISFCLSSAGNMTINDATGADVAQQIPALAFSFGANGPGTASRVANGSISAAELDNWWADADKRFAADDYVGAAGSEFDDIMIWIATPALIYRMISAEQLP